MTFIDSGSTDGSVLRAESWRGHRSADHARSIHSGSGSEPGDGTNPEPGGRLRQRRRGAAGVRGGSASGQRPYLNGILTDSV